MSHLYTLMLSGASGADNQSVHSACTPKFNLYANTGEPISKVVSACGHCNYCVAVIDKCLNNFITKVLKAQLCYSAPHCLTAHSLCRRRARNAYLFQEVYFALR